MQAGTLNEVIDVMMLDAAENTFGEEETQKYVKRMTTRASVKYTSGGRALENNEMFFGKTVEFRIRYYWLNKILDSDRIIWNKKKFRILDIEPDRTTQMLIISTESVNE